MAWHGGATMDFVFTELDRVTAERDEACFRGHRDARLTIDKILADPGKGSMGDLQYSIERLIRERDAALAQVEKLRTALLAVSAYFHSWQPRAARSHEQARAVIERTVRAALRAIATSEPKR